MQNELTYCFNKAKQHYKANELEQTRDYLDMGIARCAQITSNIAEDMSDAQLSEYDAFQKLHKDVIVEDVSLENWKMRFWVKLENWGLLL